jgi:hypothetical protein
MILLSNWFPAFGIIMQPESSDSIIFEFSLYRTFYNYTLQTVFFPTTPRGEPRR